jgi:hypothetical protein
MIGQEICPRNRTRVTAWVIMIYLLQTKLDEVFKSTRESINESQGTGRSLMLVFVILGIAIVLIFLQQWRKRKALPKPVNHHGKLLKEVMQTIALKPAEMKQLKQIAEEQSFSSPLVLLLCPSLLAKAIQNRTPEEKQAIVHIFKNVKS